MIGRMCAFLCLILLILSAEASAQSCHLVRDGATSGFAGWVTAGDDPHWQQLLAALPKPYTCQYTWALGHWYGECTVIAYACDPGAKPSPPQDGPKETSPGPGCPSCGQPINLTTGNAYIQQPDVRIPGLGGGLTLTRTWNSVWPSSQSASASGLFGLYWRSTYEERVFMGSDATMKYARADGSFWSFDRMGGTSNLQVTAPANSGATLTDNSTYWTITFNNGEQRLFDSASGSLTSIIDRNGNTTQLSYDGLNRLVTVTDPASRHLYFTYASSSSYLVTAVSSDVGLSLAYAYDTQGRLIQITKPDQTTLSFEYDSNSFITAVKDSQGKILEAHTYDAQGRGLTSTRAGGGKLLSVRMQRPRRTKRSL